MNTAELLKIFQEKVRSLAL